MNKLISRALVPDSEKSRLDERVRSGRLRTLLPGVYTSAETDEWLDLVRAAQLARPAATLTAATAARLTFWPTLSTDDVHLSPARFSSPPRWLRPSRHDIPEGLRFERDGLRIALPALAALQLVEELGGDAIDEVLRRRGATITQLVQALNDFPHRSGNELRKRLLWESRDSPWSALERRGHQELRAAGIEGWRANYRIRLGDKTYFADVAFPAAKLVVEFDGWSHHGTREAWEADLARQNDLVLAGWTVLRFTWETLRTMPELVRGALKKSAH